MGLLRSILQFYPRRPGRHKYYGRARRGLLVRLSLEVVNYPNVNAHQQQSYRISIEMCTYAILAGTVDLNIAVVLFVA